VADDHALKVNESGNRVSTWRTLHTCSSPVAKSQILLTMLRIISRPVSLILSGRFKATILEESHFVPNLFILELQYIAINAIALGTACPVLPSWFSYHHGYWASYLYIGTYAHEYFQSSSYMFYIARKVSNRSEGDHSRFHTELINRFISSCRKWAPGHLKSKRTGIHSQAVCYDSVQ